MSRYSIFKRGKIYYAQIKNPETGKYFPAKSTGKTDESEALLVVSDWLHNGLPEKTNLQQSIDINTIYLNFLKFYYSKRIMIAQRFPLLIKVRTSS